MLSPITNNNNNLKLGMGILLVSPEPVTVTAIDDIDLTTFINLGNCSKVTYQSSVDTVEHKNMQSPVARPDRKTIRGRTETLNLTCDNMSEMIYKAFVLGQDATLVTHTASGESQYEKITEFNAYSAFILGDSGTMKTGPGLVNGIVIGPAGPTDKNSIVDAATEGTVYVEGKDYRLRKVEQADGSFVANGTIEILANGRLARKILPGETTPSTSFPEIIVKYDILASTQTVIESSTDQKTWQFYFIADNADGDNDCFYIAKGQVSPSGDLNFVGEEYMSVDLTVDILVPDIQEIAAFSIIKPAQVA